MRTANTSKDHDMGYGFLLSSMFEELRISLQKRWVFKSVMKLEVHTLIGCGFKVTKGSSVVSKQGPQISFDPVPGSPSTSSTPTFDTWVQDQIL